MLYIHIFTTEDAYHSDVDRDHKYDNNRILF